MGRRSSFWGLSPRQFMLRHRLPDRGKIPSDVVAERCGHFNARAEFSVAPGGITYVYVRPISTCEASIAIELATGPPVPVFCLCCLGQLRQRLSRVVAR